MQATPPAAPRVPLAVWTTRLAYTTFFVALTFVSLAAVGMAMFDLAHRDRMYPGVQAWGLDLSGRTPAETAVLISQAFAYPQTQAITFHDGARSWSATPAELGLTLNLPATVGTAYAVGRSGNPLVDSPAQFDAWYFGAQVGPAVVYDTSRTLAYLNQLAEQVFVPADTEHECPPG